MSLDQKDGGGELVTHQELVDTLAKHQVEGGKGGEEKSVNINIDIIETILLNDTADSGTSKRSSERKGTGFVSQEALKGAVAAGTRVSFQESSPQSSAHDERVKDRKGTGFVTKEQLLHMLDDISDEEDEEADVAAAKPGIVQPPASAGGNSESKDRCKARKGTGFVTKSKLKKVLAAVGEDEES